jgi:hypothetical protein
MGVEDDTSCASLVNPPQKKNPNPTMLKRVKILIVVLPNAEVSDGGGQRAPESANGYRPPPFAQPKG